MSVQELSHDFTLDIATAHSRLSKKWKNKKWQWKDLVKRCSETKRTDETVGEYLKMTKQEQADIKDVGGFVGGYLSGGTRKTPNVMWRSIATLDIDYGTVNVWDDFTMQFDFAAMLYSTHKHTPEKPRLRLVFPLSRNVKPNEYEPLCRKIAYALGIDLFDITTYQLPRLFYWPSTSRDGEFVFEVQDGPACDVDAILSTYVNPQDVSEWPMGSRETEAVAHELRKAGDPLEKPGLIGAFCRAYTIEDAIDTFLTDAYVKTANDGRYTYKMGSVAGGLVCYEGKFAYSHHETDPASMQLCNAFDLCRIHLFGVHDEGSRVTDITRLPSYLKMQDFAAKDKTVRVLLTKERRADAESDFADVDLDEAKPNVDWAADMEVDKKGNPKNTAKNLRLIMLNDPFLKHVKFDLFGQCDRITKTGGPFVGTHAPWEIDDVSLSKMSAYIEDVYGIKMSVSNLVEKMLRATATDRAFHSVQDFILSEQWDGTQRAETILIDYLGAEDTQLVRAVTRKWLAAAVKRVFEIDQDTGEGVKFDYCLVLYGRQGTGKSTLAETLAAKWRGAISFSDGKKEIGETFQKSWIVEIPEFKGMRRADDEAVKDIISRCSDDFRAAYGRQWNKNPRHSVLIGSTNNQHFLKDLTGNRRFWLVPVKGSGNVYDWRNRLKADVGQIWAEAYSIYKQGEPLLLSASMELEMERIREGFTEIAGDPLRDYLAEWLDIPLPAEWKSYEPKRRLDYYKFYDPLEARGSVRRDTVTVCEIKCECPYRGIDKYSPQTIGGILKSLGWEYRSDLKRIEGYREKSGKNRRSSFYSRPITEDENDDI